MGQRGYEVATKRSRQDHSIPKYRVGDTVLLRDGRTVELTRVIVADWGVDYWAGQEKFCWRKHIERKVKR